jgi:hypothetical protein
MAMKYWRLKLKGEAPMDEIQSAVGESGGNVVRIHVEGGETHVYFAAEKLATPKAPKALKGATMPEEVSADEVTKIS